MEYGILHEHIETFVSNRYGENGLNAGHVVLRDMSGVRYEKDQGTMKPNCSFMNAMVFTSKEGEEMVYHFLAESMKPQLARGCNYEVAASNTRMGSSDLAVFFAVVFISI